MGYAYHFVALDEEQNTRRRHLLDSYGRFANLSILLIPLIYQLSYAVWVLLGRAVRNTPHQPAKEHQSPVVASFQKFPTPLSSKLWARLRWVLNDEIIEGWGTVQEWLIVGSWATWLLMLAIRDTGDGRNPFHFEVAIFCPRPKEGEMRHSFLKVSGTFTHLTNAIQPNYRLLSPCSGFGLGILLKIISSFVSFTVKVSLHSICRLSPPHKTLRYHRRLPASSPLRPRSQIMVTHPIPDTHVP